ncbi:orotidine-5'-phosphate decarboxylase [Alkalibacterium sp. 20]|uniref:orotidine-5'-phosphate decarboxylase n=1 Tax=Alkalibacterium sp. 20 TaxID=1798803 RepID=UPI00090028A8|nr:orotidine-5'-phosphate decarboxylase [Alkalibacterium sp. 20]OJF92932.1 orotidine 5'-phosphate decarboxylase [Alkalibacterium sp. 20]
MDNKPIIALDFSTEKEVSRFLSVFPEQQLNLKVGMELFYQQGPSIIYSLKEAGHDVFLDIKLHDIPTTVRKAMKGIARLGVDMINVHAAGGKKMMEEAREGLEIGTSANERRPLLLAVTQLTSTSEEALREEQRCEYNMEQSVLHYAGLAHDSQADGVVCSAHEAGIIKKRLGDEFLRVTPGIRLNTEMRDDQQRVATPAMARELGATHIVVGRTVTQSLNPVDSYLEVLRQWKGEQPII